MVQIIGTERRMNSEKNEFNVLILMGGVELVQSKDTGNFYATARKTSITSTFTEDVCKSLVGQKLPGAIERIECDPYEYAVPETAEVIILQHKYRYNPTPNAVGAEEAVFTEAMVTA